MENKHRKMRILTSTLQDGGHLTHSSELSFVTNYYDVYTFKLNNNILDVNKVEERILELIEINKKPDVLLIGFSSYSRQIDYSIFRNLCDKYNMIFIVDMAHVAGLIAAGVHPSPFPWADVVTSTTHKTLRGPRGGLILWNNSEYTKKINSAVFPGVQGGPLEHIIAAKGICFEEAMTEEFKEYGRQIIKNATAFSDAFKRLGWKVISDGTDNHMFVLDVYNSIGLTGKEVETLLDEVNITANKNQIPNDTLSPLVSSGLRIGTPAMTTKGFKEKDFDCLAHIIDRFLREYINGKNIDTDILKENTREAVKRLINRVEEK